MGGGSQETTMAEGSPDKLAGEEGTGGAPPPSEATEGEEQEMGMDYGEEAEGPA